jgi:hypothetical protein
MIRAVIFSLVIFVVQVAYAHDLDLTFIQVNREQSSTRIQVTTPLSRLVQTSSLGIQPTAPALDIAVRERLKVVSNAPAEIKVDSQTDLLTWSIQLDSGHEFVRQRFDDSTPSARTVVATYVSSALQSEEVIEGKKTEPTTLGMFKTGVDHILSGLDHILFVVGLALLGGSWKSILKVLTAFTIAHSLTLFAASVNFIHGSPRVVEPLIALSIVALALEGMRGSKNSQSKTEWPRIAIAFGFGLIHGFGFAGGLTELGVQGNQLVRHLLTFSIGIEVGQILILVPSLLLLIALSKLGEVKAQQFSFAISICLGMIGSFWFVERVL